jgi:hypothetical protein
MCVFCAAIPTVTVTGMALDQRARNRNVGNVKPFYMRPFVVVTIFVITLLTSLSICFHTRANG